jgi:ubiquinone/menaquinone biosynthesis C-methylase UbiE
MKAIEHETVREQIRVRYGDITKGIRGCCGGMGGTCSVSKRNYNRLVGYSNFEVASVPKGSNLGLGCGNPSAVASIRPGETVLDLGSGAGFDCFLAARQLDGTGRVIGVDMTPAMVAKGRRNAQKGDYDNVEFRLGEIEALPVADNSIDVVISNCVINLSPEKQRVFREAFRALRAGGRLAIADVVATRPLPKRFRTQLNSVGCVGGVALVYDLKTMLKNAGFVGVEIRSRDKTRSLIKQWTKNDTAGEFVASAFITAHKPLST